VPVDIIAAPIANNLRYFVPAIIIFRRRED
jgi:hypothetical protein